METVSNTTKMDLAEVLEREKENGCKKTGLAAGKPSLIEQPGQQIRP
jgi:hypothetical protein